MFSAKGGSKSSLSEGELGDLTQTRSDNQIKRKLLRKEAINKEETENLLDQSDDACQDPNENGDEGPILAALSGRVLRINNAVTSQNLTSPPLQPSLINYARGKPYAKTFPPKLAPPPKAIGPKLGAKPPAQPIKFVGIGSPSNSTEMSPERVTDDSEEGPSASPGLLKTMKELDNQDQQLFNGATPSSEVPPRGFKLNLQDTARPDSNITADIKHHNRLNSDEEKSVKETGPHSPNQKEMEEMDYFENSVGQGIDDSKLAFIDETPVDGLP